MYSVTDLTRNCVLDIAHTAHVREAAEKRGLARNIDHRGLKSVRENSSFALSGLAVFPLFPTACAVGFILAPLRG